MVSRTEQILRRRKMETTMSALIDFFIADKQTIGLSPKTLTWYRRFLNRFSEFVNNCELAELSVDDARAFIAHLQGQQTRYAGHPLKSPEPGQLSAYTVHGYVRVLKVFSSWLYEEGLSSRPIFARLKRPKLPRPLLEILDESEINTVFASINPNCFLGARLYVICVVLLDTGIRASELCGLTMAHTDTRNCRLKVFGKGSKERIVPFSPTTQKAIMVYANSWRPAPLSSDADNLILSMDGTPLTYPGLQHIIKRLGKKVGIPRLHAHLFRHTFAVKYLMNGGDVMTLKELLGHTSLDVTQLYMHLADSHVQVQHQKFSPVERMGIGVKMRRQRRSRQ